MIFDDDDDDDALPSKVMAAVFWRRVRSDVEFMFDREFSELYDGWRTSRRDAAGDSK